MIGIEAIYSTIPEGGVDVAPRAQLLGVSGPELEARIGFKRLARRYPGQEASDLCIAAAHLLFGALALEPADIECAAVVTLNPDGYGIPHATALVQRKLGLPESCATFDVGLGGSGYIYALSVMKSFMEANAMRRGLLFTSDPNSRMLDELDPRSALLFGDAATVTLLSERPVWTIGRCDFGTAGARGHAMEVRMDLGGRLQFEEAMMRDFALERVPRSVARTLGLNGLHIADVDRVVLHQAGKGLLEDLGGKIGGRDKTVFHAAGYGDTGSSSIPIVLEQNLAPTDRRILISGFGTGLSWATSVLTRAGLEHP